MISSHSLPAVTRTVGLALAGLVLAACGKDPGATNAMPAAPVAPAEAEVLVVHQGPRCGCCGLWGESMERAGFEVEVRKTDHVGHIKKALGVPAGLASCHTAEIGGYFIEGHVPASEVRRLLQERPDARGLTVPGMPAGSPGMEVPGGEVQPYQVLLVAGDGSTSVYAEYPCNACSVEVPE